MHTQFDDGSLGVKMDESESTTKFRCDMKMRSKQDGAQIFELTNSIFAPSVVVLSLMYEFLHFIIKSPYSGSLARNYL